MADEQLKYLTGRLTLDVSDLDKALKKVQATGDEVAKVGDKTKPAQQGIQNVAASVGKLGDQLSIGVTAPLLAAAGASVKLATDFGGTFAQMQALAGVSADEVDGLRQAVLNLSGSTATAPQELAKALYFIRSAGLDGQNALDALTVSAKASAIGMGSAESVADALTSVMNAYGTANITAAKAGDILTAAVREGKVEASQMAPQFGRLLPVATNLKVSFDQVAGSFAYLSRNSGDASLAATQIGGVMNALVAPMGQAAKALESVGLSGEAVRKVIQEKGLIAALRLLNDRFDGNSEALRQVFGDIQGFQGALTLIQAPASDLDGVLQRVAQSTGTLDDGFKTVSETAGFKTKQAFADLQAAAIQIGDILLPVVSQVAGGISHLVDIFSSLPGPVQTAIVVAGGFVAALGPLLSIGGRVKKEIDLIKTAVGGLKSVFSGLDLSSGLAVGAGGLAAAGVLASFTLAAQDSAKKAAEARQRVADLDAAFKGFSGSVAEANTKLAEFSKNQLLTTTSGQKAVEIANKFGLTLEDLNGYIDGNADAIAKYNSQVQSNSLASYELSSILGQQTKARHDEAAALIEQAQSLQIIDKAQGDQLRTSTNYGDVISQLKPKVDKVKDATEAAAKGQDQLATSTDTATGSLEDESGSTDAVVEKVSTLADNLKAAGDAAGQFKKGLDLVIGGNLDAIKATDSYYDALGKLADTVKGDATKSLDENTEAGRKNREAIVASTQAAFDLADATLHQGGTIQQASDIVLKNYVPALKEQLKNLGLNEQQADDYITTLGLTPEKVDTAIQISNEENAKQAVEDHLKRLDGIPKDKETQIQALIDQGKYAEADQALTDLTQPRTMRVRPIVDASDLANARFQVGAIRQQGGPVPGAVGQAMPILAHGGEFVLSADVVAAIKAGRKTEGLGTSGGYSMAGASGSSVASTVVNNFNMNIANSPTLVDADRLVEVIKRAELLVP